jgi:hypothetical protein
MLDAFIFVIPRFPIRNKSKFGNYTRGDLWRQAALRHRIADSRQRHKSPKYAGFPEFFNATLPGTATLHAHCVNQVSDWKFRRPQPAARPPSQGWML